MSARVCCQYEQVKGNAAIIYSRITRIRAARQSQSEGMTFRHSTNRWFAQRYNVNNAWIFNGNNGNLNNNNVNNGNRCQAVTNLLRLTSQQIKTHKVTYND